MIDPLMIQPVGPERRTSGAFPAAQRSHETQGPQNPVEVLRLGLASLGGIQTRVQEKITAYSQHVGAAAAFPAPQGQETVGRLQTEARQIIADLESYLSCLGSITQMTTPTTQPLLINSETSRAALTSARTFIKSVLGNPTLQQPYNLLQSSGEGPSRATRLERAQQWLQTLLALVPENGTRLDGPMTAARRATASALIQPVPTSPSSPSSQSSLPSPALPDLSIGSANAAHSVLRPETPRKPQSRADLEKPFHEAVKAAGFTIIREIGRGGMGVVYIAQDKTGRSVALKRILYAGGEEILRFQREATAVANLTKEIKGLGLLELHYFNEVNGDWIQVMELVNGPSAGKIDTSSIAAVMMRESEDPENDYLRLRTAAKRVQSSVDKATIPKDDLACLVEHFVAVGQVKPNTEEHEALARLSAQLRTGTDPRSDKEYSDSILALQRLIKTCPAISKDDSETRLKREKTFREPRATLQDLFELEDLKPEESMSGSKAKTIFKVLRESCGEDFPEAEMLQLWGYFMLGFARTMRAVDGEGVHHRDLKPANVLISEKAAEVLCDLTDTMLQSMGEGNDASRKKKLKAAVQAAISKMSEITVPLHIIDFGIVKSPDERQAQAMKAQASRSLSGELPTRHTDATANTAELTVSGQMLGTPSYMTPQSLTGMPDDPRRDLHAGIQALWEIFAGERFPIGPQDPYAQMSRILTLARDADNARDETSKKEKKSKSKKEKTPGSLIELNSDLVKTLEAQHAGLLDLSQRATYLTEAPDPAFPEVSWEEIVKELEDWLLPKPLSKRAVAGGAVALVATLIAIGGGLWKWDQRRKLETEAQQITASIDAEVGRLDSRNPKYNSNYILNRRAEIRRIYEIYGEEIDTELRQKLETAEREYEIFYHFVFFKEKHFEWASRASGNIENPEYLPLLREAASRSLALMELLQKNDYRYFLQEPSARMPHRIDDRFIRPSCNDPEIIQFAISVTENPNYSEKMTNMAEFVNRTVDQSATQDLTVNITTLERESLFRATWWMAMQTNQDAFRNSSSLRTLSHEARQELLVSLISCYQYFRRLKVALERIPGNEHERIRIRTDQGLCTSIDALMRVSEIFKREQTNQ